MSKDLLGDAYSLALVLNRDLPQPAAFKVLATAPAEDLLVLGRNGVFPKSNLTQIPDRLRVGAVSLGSGEVADWFKISDSVRKKMGFKTHQPLEETYPGDEVFDVIVARGLMADLDRAEQTRLLTKFHRSIKKGGWLIVSTADGAMDADLFENVGPGVLRRL